MVGSVQSNFSKTGVDKQSTLSFSLREGLVQKQNKQKKTQGHSLG